MLIAMPSTFRDHDADGRTVPPAEGVHYCRRDDVSAGALVDVGHRTAPAEGPERGRRSSPKSRVTPRPAGAPAAGDTFTVKVTGCPATGAAGLASTVTEKPGAGRIRTPTDVRCRRFAASRTVAVTT